MYMNYAIISVSTFYDFLVLNERDDCLRLGKCSTIVWVTD